MEEEGKTDAAPGFPEAEVQSQRNADPLFKAASCGVRTAETFESKQN